MRVIVFAPAMVNVMGTNNPTAGFDTAYLMEPAPEVPLVAAAIHDGHCLSPQAEPYVALDGATRLREEDPFTARWTCIAPWRIIGRYSRFQIDLNRPREKSVYRRAEDAWGLDVWKADVPEEVFAESLSEYDTFYGRVEQVVYRLLERYAMLVVYDIHSYNHRRSGVEGDFAPAAENPQVNLGTGTMDRQFWAPVVERFLAELSQQEVSGKALDVRENVRFQGGYFPQWIHEHFPRRVCCLAIEFKKFFMNEWTGVADEQIIQEISAALQQTVTPVVNELGALRESL